MTPFLSFLGAAALVAAPVEPGIGPRLAAYQKVADGLPWPAPDASRRPQLPDYTLEFRVVDKDGFDESRGRILRGGVPVHTWTETGHGVFLARGDVFYRADYHAMSTGCTVVAFDLKAGKELWKVRLEGLGSISHSKYHNRVRMERVDGGAFAVFGEESAGRYVELVDWQTGRTVGHKVYPRD